MRRATQSILALLLILCSIGCTTRFESSIPYARVSISYPDVGGRLTPIFGSVVIPASLNNFVGYGGVVVFHNSDESYIAYDLSCPVEVSPAIRISVLEGSPIAECPRCQTKYDLSIYGYPISGKGKERLKSYNCHYDSQTIRVWN